MVKKTNKPRIVVITGGTSGIGKGMAEMFREYGDTVCVLARSCDPTVENNFVCDVSDDGAVKKAFGAIAQRYGKIDILINNAGFGISGAMELLPKEGTQKNMDVNFFGSLYCAQEALHFMTRGAKIINISSACALFALPFRAMYCASKAAVNMLSYGLRMELYESGIDVCCVCPGDIKTEFTANRVKEHNTNERYGDRIKNAAEKIDTRQDKRMDPSVAVKRIWKLSKKKRTKPLVIIGGKYKLFFFFQRILPTSLFLAVIRKYFGGK